MDLFFKRQFFYEKVGSKAPLRFNDPFLIKKYIQFDIQHAPSRPLQKFPDTPKYPEALKNVKKKIFFFLQNFRNFANHFSKNLFPKIFLKKKVLKSPKTSRNIEKMNKKFLEKIRNPS